MPSVEGRIGVPRIRFNLLGTQQFNLRLVPFSGTRFPIMTLQSVVRACALACLITLSSSCEKSPVASTTTMSPGAAPRPAMETILHLHWLGKKKISADTNAVEVMQIWNLPESAKLEAQTLDKLSLAPWKRLGIETNQNSRNLLRPLLEDMVTEESYVEVQSPAQSTNGVGEMIVALRLDDQRASLWETNFASVVGSLTGIQPTNSPLVSSNAPTVSCWSVKTSQTTNLIEFARIGGWIVISAGDRHSLLDETIARIEQRQVPFADLTTNLWLEAQADLPRVAAFFGEHFPSDFPAISFSLAGEDSIVHTRCQLNFPNKTPLLLDPWKVPTNMIPRNLVSFTAIRGLRAPLKSSKFWTDLQIGEPPNQFYIWAAQGFLPLTQFAAPDSDASNTVARVALQVLDTNSWLASKPLAIFQRSQKFNGLEWHGLPYVSPFLKSTNFDENSFVAGGLMQQIGVADGPPPTLLPQLDHTNLVAYEWEMTGQRINQMLYIGQFMRLVSEKAQLPPDSLALAWLRAVVLKIQFSASELLETGPGQLSMVRNSDIGFTAIELNLLADWLESPEFPSGLYSLLAPPSATSPPPATY
jgi:hypothetical protein